MSKQANNPALVQAYSMADRDLRVRQSKIGCALAMVLMPAGISLDWFVYPHHVWAFLGARLICDVGLAIILMLLFTSFGRRHIFVLGISWAMLPAVCIAWMIFKTGGGVSPYYAGLNLVMIGVSLFMPWTFGEVLTTCTLTMALYAIAAAGDAAHTYNVSPSFNNVYFLVLTAIICVSTSYLTADRRFGEFRLRHELDQKNQELAASYTKLDQMGRIKSEFFANISHELRTPLTLIIAPVDEVLRRPGTSAEARESLEMVRQNALRLLQLINNLLEIVRLEEGGLQLRRERLDLAQFIPAMADSVRHVAKLKGLELRAEGVCDGGTDADRDRVAAGMNEPLTVDADPGCLEKVVINILTNAIKFTPPGGTVSLRWWREGGGADGNSPDTKAVVEFQDTGLGISEQDLPFVFDRFYQAEGGSSRKFRGAGIGLALARDLVEKHGGALTARSTAGQGTTLRLELPLSTVAASQAGPTSPSRATSPRAPLAGGADNQGSAREPDDLIAGIYRDAERAVLLDLDTEDAGHRVAGAAGPAILVVDDEPDMRRFLVTALAEKYHVLQAVDGESALIVVREHHPRLMLLDCMLPGIDGLEVCRRLRADPQTRETRIILLTARTDETSKIAALEEGADDFLTKPFSITEVRTRLANLLRAAELEDRVRIRNIELELALAKLKETEVQLVQSEKMSALGKLSAGLLHEINNPLNYTLTALQIAEDIVAPGETDLKEILTDIGEGMSRIRDVVTDLRTFAYNSDEVRHQRFLLGEALTSAVRLVSHELKDIRIDRSGIDVDGGKSVVGSRSQVIHVLMNLLMNAAHALKKRREGHEGSAQAPEITVRAENHGDAVCVHVRDNGTGIKSSDVTRIFEPFFTTKDVGEGMGLGLSICHTIVRNHGGNMRVQSVEGEYTDMSFDLPTGDSVSGRPAEGAASLDGPAEEDSAGVFHSADSEAAEQTMQVKELV